MLVPMIEMMSLAASNSLAVFFFCNLIIAFLLICNATSHSDGVMKPRNESNADNLNNSLAVEANGFIATAPPSNGKESSVMTVSIDMVTIEEDDDDDDDELKKRVEDFIEKINRGEPAVTARGCVSILD
ncbi:hypothetical protein C2S53_013116 [Perilla frutescens var. hirtella]|uniref:Uncharacterized protein n=1 Tax=Perilla frutescens var. hirtella TaxID=608512 RepID=A0AAD4J7I8_PERFH|nr:hypothetical protein C2S53_013116 [Perilla frutescens var. hirtella]